MGVEQLAGLLGPNSVRLLELLNERNITASTLAGLVLSQFGPEHLLFDRQARDEILQALRPEDASRLARGRLGRRCTSSPSSCGTRRPTTKSSSGWPTRRNCASRRRRSSGVPGSSSVTGPSASSATSGHTALTSTGLTAGSLSPACR